MRLIIQFWRRIELQLKSERAMIEADEDRRGVDRSRRERKRKRRG